jgi:arylsulfatase A-like enzyme
VSLDEKEEVTPSFGVARRIGLVWLIVAAAAVAPAQERPNILLVVSDDLNTRIGPYVDASLELHTPNLDRLAAGGIRFTRAYTQYPVCGPARASFMSGLYPETNGVITNAFDSGNYRTVTPSLADHPTLAGFFRQRGYYTARVSKIFHMGVPGGIERGEAGSDDPDSWDYAINIMAPETLTRGNLEKLSRGDHYGSNFSRMILPDGDELSQADVLAADQAIAILENRSGTKPPHASNRTKFKENAPFFLAVGFVRPHVPLIAPERHFAHYPHENIRLPYVPNGDLDDVPRGGKRLSNAARFGMNATEQRKSIAAYYASIRFMDEQLGRILDALERLGLRDDTIVVFTSDHGFNLGEHTCWQKTSLWEESVQVPLIISVPGMRRAGAQTDAIVELIDLYPTFVEMSDLVDQAPSILQGDSLVPLFESPADTDPEATAYTITSGDGASLRTGRWRYNRWGENAEGDNEEFYDHDNDPMEHKNLARDPTYRSVLDEIRAQFEQMRKRARSEVSTTASSSGLAQKGIPEN